MHEKDKLMFVISLPKTVGIGDTVDCRINTEPAKVTYRDANTLVIEPGDARQIVFCNEGSDLITFVCADDDGTRPTIFTPEGVFEQRGGSAPTEGPVRGAQMIKSTFNTLAEALHKAGYKTQLPSESPRARLENLMAQAVIRNGGNTDSTRDDFIKRLLEQEDWRLIWELCGDYRRKAIDELFTVVLRAIKYQNRIPDEFPPARAELLKKQEQARAAANRARQTSASPSGNA